MESFADLGRLTTTGQDLGKGFEIDRFKYDAVIDIHRCPAKVASLLLATLLVWLAENDPDRETNGLDAPEVDVTIEDEQTVFVQITVEFKESIYIVQDPEGPISWNGGN